MTSALLLFAAVLLRGYYALKVAPPVLNQDESAILLNARFLAEKGVDEYGQKYPVVFRSFGDAKLPGYIYTTAVLWKLFPFDAVVKVPAFLAGLAVLILSGRVVFQLTGKSGAGLATMLLLLLSPWGFHFSSVGFEAHLGLAFFLAALSLWLRKPANFFTDGMGALFLLSACLTYNAPLLLAPFVGGAILIYRGKKKETFSLAAMLFAVLILAVSVTFAASSQKKGIAFIQDGSVLAEYPGYRAQYSGLTQKFVGNQWVYFGTIFIRHIIDSFSWEFLVLRGGANPWHAIPHVGHLHLLIPLLAAMGQGTLVGSIWHEWRTKRIFDAFLRLLLLGIGLVSLFPAAITTDAPHATRSLFFFVCLTGLAGWQLFSLYDRCCQLVPDKYFTHIRFVLSLLIIGGFLLWWAPTPRYWSQFIDAHWYMGLEQSLDTVPQGEVFIQDPEGVLYTRVANHERMRYEEYQSSIHMSAPAQTGLMRGERLGRYTFVFGKNGVGMQGVYLEQKSAKEWGTIEL